MPQKSPIRAQQSAPAEILSSLNLGVNDYTDPTLQTPRQWAAGQNSYSGAFGYVQRARFANLVTNANQTTVTITSVTLNGGGLVELGASSNLPPNFVAGVFIQVLGLPLIFGQNVNGIYPITSTGVSQINYQQVSTNNTGVGTVTGLNGTATVNTVNGYLAQNDLFTSFKFFALPGLSNYLLGDHDGTLFSFDTGNSYFGTPRFNNYLDPNGTGMGFNGASMSGPWMREVLQNIVYEMNGGVKQAGRGANAATIEGWGLDAPDVSPQIVISAGTSQNISSIARLNGTVTVTLAAALTVPGGNGIGMVNVVGETNDPAFNGTFVVLTGSGTTTLTWAQQGQNTTPAAAGAVNTSITKSVGRSYAVAWENANKSHVGAPSPSTQFILYNSQNGAIQIIEQGTIAGNSTVNNIVTGVGTAFTSAWVGKRLYIPGQNAGNVVIVTSVQSTTSMTVAYLLLTVGMSFSGSTFMVYDFQATHIRLYESADGGATYFRCQRNAFNQPNPSRVGTLALIADGLQFFDNGNSEPPNFPFTTEVSQLYNVPPPVGAFVKEYQGRLLIWGGTIPGQTFFYTNIESTTIGLTQESCAPLNQVTLPIQNANISGMADLPGDLIIWSDKQDMFRLTGLLSDNTPLGLGTVNTAAGNGTAITSLPYNLGCANPFAVAITPLGAIWVTSNRELWLFTDKYAPRNIGRPIQGILSSIPTNQLVNIRTTYYHSLNRNWVSIALSNGANNNVLVNLDLDLLASNGAPSFFTFDMATNHPAFWVYNINCSALEVVYETGGQVRLVVGSTDLIQDPDYQTGLFGTETSVTGYTIFQPWGNDSAFVIKRPTWMRFTTNQDPSQLALQGWSFAALGIDDDYYTFNSPLTLTLQPGINDSSSLCGNPNLFGGEPFRHSPELFRIGGVNFVMGRRIQFIVNFPTGIGVNYALRTIQLGFGASPPR
jgi:hypothetical protein